ncbi:hypothetical protein [Singulisphaera sp. PoT]|uniref:hypothetical protein n=1 Tax=Singulisphaera sp. PoT TaxID=3411797 RepID=UPI003BF5AF07
MTVHHEAGVTVALSTGLGWWLVNTFYQHGPSWELCPPILFGTAAVIGAVKSWKNDEQKREIERQKLRHEEDRHRLEMSLLEEKHRIELALIQTSQPST